MLINGDVFELENKRYILLGLSFYNQRPLEVLYDTCRYIRTFYQNVKKKEDFLAMILFFNCVFAFIPYEDFLSDKPIENMIELEYGKLYFRIKFIKHEDITGYLVKNALVNPKLKRFMKYDVSEIEKKEKAEIQKVMPELYEFWFAEINAKNKARHFKKYMLYYR